MPAVLHLVATDARRGGESFGWLLAERLRERGWRSDVLAVRRVASGSLPVESLGRAWHDPRGLVRFRRRSPEYDVVLAHGSTTLWTAALGRLAGAPPFVYVNIGDPLFWTASPVRRRRVSWLLHRADRVVALAAGAVPALTGHLGLPPAAVAVIPNGRSTRRFRPATPAERADARRRLDLPADRPVVAYVGALSTEKRPDLALQAVASHDTATLVVAGEGPLRAPLQAQSSRTAPGRVRWLGAVQRVEDVYAAADVLLLSSDSEGVPGVLIEAGLSGLPAVTTDVGFAAGVVLDGVTGRVVPRGDAVALHQGLMDALAHATTWGAAARQHCCTAHDLDAVVSGWDGLLRDVAARSRRGAGASQAACRQT